MLARHSQFVQKGNQHGKSSGCSSSRNHARFLRSTMSATIGLSDAKWGAGHLQRNEPLWGQFFSLVVLVWFLAVCGGSLHAQIYSYETNGSSFFYETNNGTIRIWNCISSAGQITIPSTINGDAVTEIGGGAFGNLLNVTNLVIPDTVVLIGASAFSGCSALVTATIGNHVATIPQQCFYNCNYLSSVSIPNSTTNIGASAFAACLSLTNAVIGSGVINIGFSAFQSCYSLSTFTVDSANQAFSSSAGVLFDKSQTKLIQFPPGRSGSYSIPTTVTNISTNAFSWCSGLTNLTITRNVTTIGVPVFHSCPNLTTIPVEPVNPTFTNVDGIVFNKATTTIVLCPPGKTGVFSVPNSVTNIGAFAFYESRLTRVIVGKHVLDIGNSAFLNSSVNEMFFLGDAPTVAGSPFGEKAVAYYMPGTTGWSSRLGNAPAVLWDPRGSAFGVRSNRFGFTIRAATNIVVVVEACTNLAISAWRGVSTNTLTNTVGGGACYFSDPQLFNAGNRFYRFRSP